MSYPNDPSGPQPPYGGQPPYGPPGGQPPYGDPTGGQQPYGAPGGQPPYGPPGGQPPYGPPGDQPPYGDPTGGQQPYDPYGVPGAPPQKQGMSTGAKVGIGVGVGCLALIVIAVVIFVVIALAVGDDTDTAAPSSSPTSSRTTEPGGTTEEPAEEPVEAPAGDGVTVTAAHAGTVSGTLDPSETYTALDVTFVNNSDEPFSINPLYFSYILEDGTEVIDWELFADITQFEAGDLAPGEQVSGQVAIAGEVTVAEVHYDPYFGLEDPIVVPVQ